MMDLMFDLFIFQFVTVQYIRNATRRFWVSAQAVPRTVEKPRSGFHSVDRDTDYSHGI
jgi:hypothetical protein